MSFSLLLTGSAVVSTPAGAAGFYLQEQSTTALGSEFAGAGAEPRDASIMYYNPAGIADLDRAQITGGVSALKAFANSHDKGSTTTTLGGGGPAVTAAGGRDGDNMIPISALPNIYAAAPLPFLDHKLWVGLGFSVPFGLKTQYGSTWYGRFDSRFSSLKVYDIQPTVAYKVADWISIGGGVNIQHAQADLTNQVTNVVSEGKEELKGNDWSAGYNLGILLTPVAGTKIGLDYRSKVDHNLKGSATVTGTTPFIPFGIASLDTDIDAKANLDLPDIAGVSLSQVVAPQWKVLGQVNYFHWGRFNSITPTSGGAPIAGSTIAEDYNDTWSYAIGGEYAWRPDVTFRFGYQFDETPTQNPYRDTRVPDGNRNNFGVGVSYDITKDLTFNAAASYSIMNDANVDVIRNGGLARVRVKRDDTSFVFGALGMTYKF